MISYLLDAIINRITAPDMQNGVHDPWERAVVGLWLGMIVLLLMSTVTVLWGVQA